MKLYHGTTYQAAEYIEEEGFIGGEFSEMTDGFTHVEGGVVYLASTIKEAHEYGDAIFEIDFDMMDCEQPVEFFDGDSHHYYSPAANINRNALVERIL